MPAAARKLIVRIGFLLLAVVLTGALASQYDVRKVDNDYIAAVLEKDRLIRHTPSPKIILVGGSNLAFGIDSHMMEDSLGVHVVNMGLYAKLGLRYMLAQIKPYIRRGDIVVVVPEYDQFYGNFANGDNTLNTALLYAPSDRISDFVKSYSIIDVVVRPRAENARRAFLHAAAAAVGRENQFYPPDTNPVYNRHSFNDRGDVISHLGRKGKDPDSIFVRALPSLKTFNAKTVDDLNGIADDASTVGAKSYFMFPSYMERAYALSDKAIDSLQAKIGGASRMPFVGSARDFVFADSLFFDTRFHLTGAGRAIRSVRMIDILRAAGERDGWLPRRTAEPP
ncbi:MAG: hypothetical protein ABIQ55_13370, partial [Gemmatimonadaceae bacterium]